MPNVHQSTADDCPDPLITSGAMYYVDGYVKICYLVIKYVTGAMCCVHGYVKIGYPWLKICYH